MMLKRISLFVIFVVFLFASQYMPFYYPNDVLALKAVQTFTIIFLALFLDSVIGKLMSRIKLFKVRYFISKISSYFIYLVAVIVAMGIWIEQTQSLVVAMGFIGAGIAIALQRPLMNLVGFLVLITVRPYEAGHRISIDGEKGDVIDIELMYTKLMEIGGDDNFDQFTGRIKEIPNSFVLEKVINNYSKDFDFTWDEITIPITYSSNLKKAKSIMEKAARRVTKKFADKSEEQLKKMTYKYLFEPREVRPEVYVIPTDNWVELRLRFIVESKHRRRYVDPIFQEILGNFQNSPDIRISSKTTARVWDTPRKQNY